MCVKSSGRLHLPLTCSNVRSHPRNGSMGHGSQQHQLTCFASPQLTYFCIPQVCSLACCPSRTGQHRQAGSAVQAALLCWWLLRRFTLRGRRRRRWPPTPHFCRSSPCCTTCRPAAATAAPALAARLPCSVQPAVVVPLLGFGFPRCVPGSTTIARWHDGAGSIDF